MLLFDYLPQRIQGYCILKRLRINQDLHLQITPAILIINALVLPKKILCPEVMNHLVKWVCQKVHCAQFQCQWDIFESIAGVCSSFSVKKANAHQINQQHSFRVEKIFIKWLMDAVCWCKIVMRLLFYLGQLIRINTACPDKHYFTLFIVFFTHTWICSLHTLIDFRKT